MNSTTLPTLRAGIDVDWVMAPFAAEALARAGKLDEAESAARDLLTRYPEVPDGWDRLGMVCTKSAARTGKLPTATAG